MKPSVFRSDIFEKSIYSLTPRKRQCRTVSVSDNGFVATLDNTGCIVLNPYTKDLYDICQGKSGGEGADGEKEVSKQVLTAFQY